jgi:hypothetical protein
LFFVGLGICVGRWAIECRIYIARRPGKEDSGAFAASASRTKTAGVGIFGIGVGERVEFGPRILSSSLFLAPPVCSFLLD